MKSLFAPIFFFSLMLIVNCTTPVFDLTTDKTAFLSIIPEPKSIHLKEGTFLLSAFTQLLYSPEFKNVGNFIKNDLANFTKDYTPGYPGSISLRFDPEIDLNEEGYHLDIDKTNNINITAKTEAGVFYAYQTLKQLLPPKVYQNKPTVIPKKSLEDMGYGQILEDYKQASQIIKDDNLDSLKSIPIPCLTITDEPRYSWRGLMLDVGRHFMPVADIKKFIDSMVMHKLNTFHWHLTEDQGWRIEIKQYPKLTEVGAWRAETKIGHYFHDQYGFDGIPHGGFYTQEEVKEVVAYAAERFITVIPEIEMPGHSQAAIASYPEIGHVPEGLPVRTNWGINTNALNVKDSTIQFYKNVLDEVMELFPSTYIHIGGDECTKTQWENDAYAQQKIAELGLGDEDGLQSWFIEQFDEYLSSKGRKLIGWDEILEGGLTKGATVMSWQGEKGGIAAANMGHDVVMSPTTYVYLDYYQGNKKSEPLAISNLITLEHIYNWNPQPTEIAPDKVHHVIGGQGNIWTNYMKDMEQVMYMTYPRASAMSECLWSENDQKDFAKFNYKMQKHHLRLANADISLRYPDIYAKNINLKCDNSGSSTINLTSAGAGATSGFYQIHIQNSKGGEIQTSKVELLVGSEVVATQERNGVTNETFNQSTVYTLEIPAEKLKSQGDAEVSAKIYYTLPEGGHPKAKVRVKVL